MTVKRIKGNGTTHKPYLLFSVMFLLLVNIGFIIYRYICWGVIWLYDIDALKTAVYNEGADNGKTAQYALDSIFDNIKWEHIYEIGFCALLFALCFFIWIGMNRNRAD